MKRSQAPRYMTGKEGRTDVENMQSLDYTFCRKVIVSVLWDSQGVSFIDFLTEQRIINASYYSKLLKEPAKLVFRSK
jgi:hypothetical protein